MLRVVAGLVLHTPEARAKQGSTQRQHRTAQVAWSASSQTQWLTDGVHSDKIQPLLAGLPNSDIAHQIGVSLCYAGHVRKGRRPHPRHWLALAQLVGVSPNT